MTPPISRGHFGTRAAPFPMHAWEPPLSEMLADPVVQAVMAVDGVRPADVVALLGAAKARVEATAALR